MINLTEKEYDKLVDELADTKKKLARLKSTDRETIEVSKADLKMLLKDNENLKEQVNTLRASQTALVEKQREESILWNVEEFHNKFNYPVRKGTPTSDIPDDEAKHRARLIMEEAFETLESIIPSEGDPKKTLVMARTCVKQHIDEGPVDVDLPELADGLVNLEYVIAGSILTFAIPRADVLKEVQRANMSKDLSRDGLNKPVKPEGWTPPDIEAVLRNHGWHG